MPSNPCAPKPFAPTLFLVMTLGVTLAACELAFPNVVREGPNDAGTPAPDGPSAGTILWVQAKSGGASATFDRPETADDLNVVVMSWGDNTHTITGVSDTLGNTYAVAAPTVSTSGTHTPPLSQAIYYARNMAAGANTVTVAFNGAPNLPDLRILEYQGSDPVAPFDVTAAATGTGAGMLVASGTMMTRSPNELIVGAAMSTDKFAGPGPTFTQRILSTYGNLVEDRSVTSAGSYAASAPLSSVPQDWIIQMVTFRARSGG